MASNVLQLLGSKAGGECAMEGRGKVKKPAPVERALNITSNKGVGEWLARDSIALALQTPLPSRLGMANVLH